MSNCCSHGTLLHFSLQRSHLNICYYHQDLHWGPFQLPLRAEPSSRFLKFYLGEPHALLSFQSAFHLSITLLVRYRSLANI